jgi:hypothetical protein
MAQMPLAKRNDVVKTIPPFGFPAMILGAVLSAFVASSAGQRAVADSIETPA